MFTAVIILSAALCLAIFFAFKYARALSALREEFENSSEERQVLLDFLHTITEDVAKGADKAAVYERLLRATASSCGALGACVFERRGGKFAPAAVEGLFPPLSKKIDRNAYPTRNKFLEAVTAPENLADDRGLVAGVFTSGKPLFIRSAEGDSRVAAQDDDAIKIKSLIAAPVMFAGNKYGVLAVINPISQKTFTPTIFSLAQALGEQGGLALFNLDGISARVAKSQMESDLRLASSVQKFLLPKRLPSTDKFSISVKYMPHQLIGGDFYDIINMPDGRTGVVIADVSGKGVSAAMLMAVAQSKLHYIARMGMTPAQTLMKLNAELVRSMRSDMFITITFAILENGASQMTLARAGHELPLIYRSKTGACEKLKSPGMAVGMVPPEIFDAAIEDASISLDSGDIAILYTDGLTEASNREGEEFSQARLMRTIETCKKTSAAELNSAIIKSLEIFTDENSHSDDLTLLSIKKQ